MKQSAKTSEKLRTNLSDEYTTGEKKYPTSCQVTLHYLENHGNSVVCAPIAQEVSPFAQRKSNGNPDTFDKTYWNKKECYNCGDKGHPESHCKTKLYSNGKKKKNYDKNSLLSSKSSTHTMVGKINKDIQKTKISFAAIKCMIKNIEEEEDDSDISDSDSESGLAFFKWNVTSSPPMEKIS